MDTVIIKIMGMKDAECVRTIANAIQDLPHIGAIEISLERAEASVEHGRLIELDDILRAIEDAGYRAEYCWSPLIYVCMSWLFAIANRVACMSILALRTANKRRGNPDSASRTEFG